MWEAGYWGAEGKGGVREGEGNMNMSEGKGNKEERDEGESGQEKG